nr:HD domain-containing phosphohydrolase [Halanaerobacter jeridensis]
MANEIGASYEQLEAYSEELEHKNKELEKNKKRVRKIIDLSPNHIFIKDRQGEYKLVNQTHAQFFGKSVEDFQGLTEQELYQLDENKIDEFLKNDRQVIDDRNNQVFEGHVIDDEGNKIIFETTKIPFVEGDETYVLAIARDITEQRAAKNRIKEQKEELEASYQQLEAYNKEILELNQNLETSYQERDALVKKLEKLIDLTAELSRETLSDSQEFLSQLLHSAFEIIDEADYGSVYSFGEQHIEYVDAIGHDLEALQSLDIENEVFSSNPTEPQVIKNITNRTEDRLDEQVQEVFLDATRPIKETIVFALVVDGEKRAGFSLDIAQESEAEFSQQSVQIIEAFNSLAISFYIMQNYNSMRSDFQSQIVSSLINLLEVHDQYTKGHSENVARLGTKVAFELGLSIEEINDVYWAGLLHDIGKTVVPKEILNKPGRLTEAEYEKIKKHPVWGYKALKDSEQLEDIAEYIYHHHERPNSQGYPEGLSEVETPLISKILSVVDAWDAMRSTRSYREPLSKEKALSEIINNRGTQFSPQVVDAFLKIIKENNIS